MKRLLILVAVVALAMCVTIRPALAASAHHGGHHSGHVGHRGGHVGHRAGHVRHHSGHVRHHVGVGHLGRHSVHRGSGRHLSVGLGHHYSSYYGYRYPYSYRYGYSYPAYRSYSAYRSYGYPTYQRAYRYGYSTCSSPSVILIQPNQPKTEEDEQPKVEPAPEPVPPPAPAAVPRAGTSPRSLGTIRHAVLRNVQPLSERATVQQPAKLAPNRITGPTPRPSAASKRPSAAGALGPQLAVPKVRSLISDDDVPWVAQ